jgi:acyl-phosphate glycerol-3-phosphate acyltransferase
MHNPILLTAICAVVSFFIGAIPFGLILGRVFNHTDIRKAGSGNIGTTNALRVAGPKVARSRCCSTALRAPSASLSPVRSLPTWAMASP